MHRYLHNKIYTIPMLRSINRNIPFLLPFNLVIRFRKEEIIDDISLSSFKNRRPNWFERKSFHCLESLDILLQGKIIISSINISNNPLFFPSSKSRKKLISLAPTNYSDCFTICIQLRSTLKHRPRVSPREKSAILRSISSTEEDRE